MAIIQISKIQQRAGNLVDLPQLDNAEFGWAADENRLFIGRTGNTVTSENIEVLTSYSNISFSQITGSDGGNFNISNAENGQILTYITSTNTWDNYPNTDITNANANFKLNLGNVEYLTIGGQSAIGYVLQTDGAGNLSWAPKGTLYTSILGLSNANPIVMTVDPTTPYTNNAIVTISGVIGANNSIVNGKAFYIQLATNFPTTGHVSLYNEAGGANSVDGTGLTYTNSPNAIATSLTGGSGGSSGGQAGGVTTTVQYNDSGILAGDSGFTFNSTTKSITLTGNVAGANLYASTSVVSPVLTSNVAVGTAPLTVTSTTRVANLNVSYANVSDYSVTTTQTTGTFYPTFVSANTSGNYILASNANLAFNAATGALSATLLTGTITTAFQPNITTVGTLGALTVTANITSGNANLGNAATANYFVGNGSYLTGISATTSTSLANGTSNVTIPTSSGNVNISSAGNANIAVITGTGANISGTLNASGNANVGNLGTGGRVIASILESNVVTGTAPLTVASTTRVTNLNVAYSNVTDFIAITAAAAGTYYPTFTTSTANANLALVTYNTISANPQTGLFSATTLSATGNANVGNIGTGGLITATGNITGGNLATTGTANVGTLNVTGNVTSNLLPSANITYDLGSATQRWKDLYLANSTIYLGANATISANTTAVVITQPGGTVVPLKPGGANTQVQYNDDGIFGGNPGMVFNEGTTTLTVNNFAVTSNANLSSTTLTIKNITTGANTTQGNITGNWVLTAGSKMQATYADLAEYYEADQHYEPGTVLEFGGEKEVTLAEDGTSRVAGVVSTDPAYAMNMKCPGIATAIALQGRVPTKVRGVIHKGDMMISGGNGFARPCSTPQMGTVIGKALENFDGIEGIIEIAVGRL